MGEGQEKKEEGHGGEDKREKWWLEITMPGMYKLGVGDRINCLRGVKTWCMGQSWFYLWFPVILYFIN